MTRRNKLELEINSPVTFELLYDEPITGSSDYGDYFMYAVNAKGIEYAFFAPDEVHAELKKLSKGDKATITKLAAQKGNKLVVKYDVQLLNYKPKAKITTIGEVVNELLPEEITSNADKTDSLYNIMKQSYIDALEINSELNGSFDVAKIATTLFIARSKNIH